MLQKVPLPSLDQLPSAQMESETKKAPVKITKQPVAPVVEGTSVAPRQRPKGGPAKGGVLSIPLGSSPTPTSSKRPAAPSPSPAVGDHAPAGFLNPLPPPPAPQSNRDSVHLGRTPEPSPHLPIPAPVFFAATSPVHSGVSTDNPVCAPVSTPTAQQAAAVPVTYPLAVTSSSKERIGPEEVLFPPSGLYSIPYDYF